MRILTWNELLWTKNGRKWLEEWCRRTVFTGDAKTWLSSLKRARKRTPDQELPDDDIELPALMKG